ncbi:MAG TPA: hypothetical protein VLA89_18255 [Gemmatimonadales bacterium]|nr:hypothetical protein [Gemmatimonadales bacterium]
MTENSAKEEEFLSEDGPVSLPYDLDHEGTGYLRQISMMLPGERGSFVLVANTHDYFHGRPVPLRE